MQTLTDTATKNHGIASASLAPDLININARTAESGLTLVTGTFNVGLYAGVEHVRADEYRFNRQEEVLCFERCRLKRSGAAGPSKRCFLMRSSVNQDAEYKRTLEIMSDCHLRNALEIEAGDQVIVEVAGDENWWNSPDREWHAYGDAR